MKIPNRYLIGLMFFVLTIFGGQAQNIVGQWKTIDDDTQETKSIVELYKKDGEIYGKVLQLLLPEDQGKLCTKCTGEDYNKPIEGLVIVKGLSKDGDGEYTGGTIFDSAKGKEYKCKMWIDKDQPDMLNVRGYVAFFYRTQHWHRVTE